ncbi:MAG TPA: hypothetical protein VGA78_06210 [Gemmatimonadales bacterium]
MRIPLLVVALFWPLSLVLAQDTEPLTPRTRLRVTLASTPARVQIGSYQALTDTTLLLSAGSSRSLTIPLSSISRLEWSRGRRPGVLGGVLGLILGAGVGGVVACSLNRDDYGVFCGGQDDTKVVVGAALGGAAGTVIGALLFRRERWNQLDLVRLRSGRP